MEIIKKSKIPGMTEYSMDVFESDLEFHVFQTSYSVCLQNITKMNCSELDFTKYSPVTLEIYLPISNVRRLDFRCCSNLYNTDIIGVLPQTQVRFLNLDQTEMKRNDLPHVMECLPKYIESLTMFTNVKKAFIPQFPVPKVDDSDDDETSVQKRVVEDYYDFVTKYTGLIMSDLYLSMLSLRNNITLTELHNDCFSTPRNLHMICPKPFSTVSAINCKELGTYIITRNIYIQSVIKQVIMLLLLAAKFPSHTDNNHGSSNLFYGILNHDLMKVVAKQVYASRNELVWRDAICRGTNFDVKGINELTLNDVHDVTDDSDDSPYLSF